MISFNAWLSIALVIMFAASVLNHMAARRRDLDLVRVVNRIDAMLITWAEHWGGPPEEVKSLLAAIIEEWRVERRLAERRRF